MGYLGAAGYESPQEHISDSHPLGLLSLLYGWNGHRIYGPDSPHL